MEPSNGNWALTQNQFEILFCKSYTRIYDQVCFDEEQAVFADDNKGNRRHEIIHQVAGDVADELQTTVEPLPPEINVKVRDFNGAATRVGILLGPQDLFFPLSTETAHEECLTDSPAASLESVDDLLAQNFLSGRLIGEVWRYFNRIIRKYAQHNDDLADFYLNHPDVVREIIDRALKPDKETDLPSSLTEVPPPNLELPSNVNIVVIPEAVGYTIHCERDPVSGSFAWTFVLPIHRTQSETMPPVVANENDGCVPPCLKPKA